jgi:hypothetical protein
MAAAGPVRIGQWRGREDAVVGEGERLIERLRREFGELEWRPSQFTGGPALWLNGREIVHLHGDEVEIRLTRREAARRDHDGFWQRTRSSDWVGLAAADDKRAVELTRVAIAANRRTGSR